MAVKRLIRADSLKTFEELLRELGARAQHLRLLRNVPQEELAVRAGVGVKALRRFERSGEGTVETALRLALALGADAEFEALFSPPPYQSLADAEARERMSTRQRARRRR